MGHADLLDLGSSFFETSQDLSVDQEMIGLKLEPFDAFSPKELESAVDIAHLETEKKAAERRPQEALHAAVSLVLTIDAVTHDRVAAVDLGEKFLDVGELELVVAVGQKNQVFRDILKAGAEGGPVAEITLVTDQFDARIVHGLRADDVGGVVPASVIDNDDLIIHAISLRRLDGLVDHRTDILGLIVARKENRQRRERFGFDHNPSSKLWNTRPERSLG